MLPRANRAAAEGGAFISVTWWDAGGRLRDEGLRACYRLFVFSRHRSGLVLVRPRRLTIRDLGLFRKPLAFAQYLIDFLQGPGNIGLSRGVHFRLIGKQVGEPL